MKCKRLQLSTSRRFYQRL